MDDDQFTKLFKYVQTEFQKVHEQLEAVRADQADIRGAIAELSAQVRDYHHETMVMSHQIDKLRDAILQIAQETGVKLRAEI